MFHFWFNTFFIHEEEQVDFVNGSSASQSISATPSTFYTSHQHDQHRPVVPSLSSSLPTSFPASQQAHNSVSHTASCNSYGDRKLLSISQNHPKSSIHPQQNQSPVPTQQYHQPLQSGTTATPAQHYHNRLLLSQANATDSANSNSAATMHVNRQVHQPPTHRKQTYRTLTLKKMELDKANKDKQHKLFQENFEVSTITPTILLISIRPKASNVSH